MDPIYLIIVIILLGLAVLDLTVGVANDAVNFLNSSIGSKVAPMWVILTVASLGIMLGTMFSSGMMEIARSGVFHPEMFSFKNIMVLFLAVMLTDVILLDVFNSLGCPLRLPFRWFSNYWEQQLPWRFSVFGRHREATLLNTSTAVKH